MESIILEKDELTPAVNFNKTSKLMKLEGRCIPEDAHTFFVPLITWVTDLFEQPDVQKSDEYLLDITCDYYNSASAKMLVYLFDKIAEIQKQQYNFKVIWHCNVDDPDLVESINDYMDITGVSIEITSI